MASSSPTPTVSIIPFALGFLLWAAATALLLEDAYHTGHVTVSQGLMPVLTASTVAAAVFAHRRLMSWKIFAALMFATLAVLGSGLTVYGTLGRIAEQHEGKTASRKGANDDYKRKEGELAKAAVAADRECATLGKRCLAWQSRVDQLTAELAGLVVVSEDPKIDAAVNFISLLSGADAKWIKKLLSALEPVSLPFFLEFGSIVFFAAAFPHRKCLPPSKEPLTLPLLQTASDASVAKSFSVSDARRDLQQLKACNSQAFLASRWGVSESTVSRWLQAWHAEGTINRTRDGKNKATLALPPPEPARRKRLGQMVSIN